MNSNFDARNPSSDTLDHLKRDRFELLSAYMDGEVTADERRQVNAWLETDPEIQCLYSRLIKLRDTMRTLPTPAPVASTEDIVGQVLCRLERRSRRRWFWGGAAIAAAFVSAVSSLFIGGRFAPQVAQTDDNNDLVASEVVVDDDALMIALDRPIIEMPTPSTESPAVLHKNVPTPDRI